MSKEHKPPLLGSEFYNRVEEITGLSGLHFLALKKEKITTVGGLEDVIFKQLQWEVSHQLSPDYDRHVSHLQQLNSYLKGVLSEPIVVSEIDTDIESLLRSKSSTWHRAYGKLRNLDGRLPATNLSNRAAYCFTILLVLSLLPIASVAGLVTKDNPIVAMWFVFMWLILVVVFLSWLSARHMVVSKPVNDLTLRGLFDRWAEEKLQLQRSLQLVDIQRIVRDEYRSEMQHKVSVPRAEIKVDEHTELNLSFF